MHKVRGSDKGLHKPEEFLHKPPLSAWQLWQSKQVTRLKFLDVSAVPKAVETNKYLNSHVFGSIFTIETLNIYKLKHMMLG